MAYTVYDEDTLGNKPPVLVLHGLFGSRNNWNSLSRSLNRQTKRKIIAADFRNHGDSPHTQKMTFQNLAWDIQHLLDKLNIKESILLGHSMGGAAVMFTALTYPYLLEKLVVVDMSPVKTRSGPLEISGIMSAMNSVDFRGLQTLSQARQHADKVLSETIRSSTLRQFLITNVKEESPGSFKWKVNVPSLMEHFGPEIVGFPALLARLGGKTFTKPTLFISGGRSDYMTKEDHPGTRKLFPGAEFVYIEDAAHWLHVEKPVEFLKIASDFINS
ncbi:alpha/beta hydrolase domain-containing protein 11 [Fopius arisanus]|uniref:sn-1-specific diacylglycerol lipase ABHD11 n=1 Tax=Fopius arisanus TaxID=64838 RepID=A0A9R1U8C7_9HYME|nr:PREDICTED: alpha/beta hydrolase domain-containing protein 11-like [Fopius arisanus]